MKVVLLTGATGFVGRHCIKHLIDAGYAVHATYNRAALSGFNEVTWHKVDLLNNYEVESVLEQVKPTHVLHAAWYAEHGKFWTHKVNQEWVKASLNLLNISARNDVKRIVGVGTCAEYDWSGYICREYSTSIKPLTLYGQCKAAVEKIFEGYCRDKTLSTAWGRLFFLYGPYENKNKVIASVILSLLKDKEALCSNGEQVRDFMYVEDAALGLVKLLDSNVTGAVNIATGTALPLKDLLIKISTILGKPELIKLGSIKTPAGEVARIEADTERLVAEVGFKPQSNFEDTLQKTIEWWQRSI